jgi:hypothetical protein
MTDANNETFIPHPLPPTWLAWSHDLKKWGDPFDKW